MANPDVGTKPRSVKADTSMYGQNSTKSCSVVEDLHKSRRELDVYKDSIRDSESVKARGEVELSKAKNLVEELTLLIENSNRGAKLLKVDTKLEESGDSANVLKDLESVKEEASRLKFDVSSVLGERTKAEKEFEDLRFKTQGDLRLIEKLEKEIEAANEEQFLVELGTMEALSEGKEIERRRGGERKKVLDMLLEKKKRVEEMLEEVERSKSMEKELLETTSDVEMLETQLNLVKKMENSMSRSNRYSLSVLREAKETKKEELGSVNGELFKLMRVMDALRSDVNQAKEETVRYVKILRKVDVKIQRLNSELLMVKSKLRVALSAKERASSLADNLAASLEKLKRNKEAAKREERLLKEEKIVTEVETEKGKLEVDEKEKELILKFDKLERAKHSESLVLEKLESLIEETMKRREMESEHCSTITISRFEYEYLSRHASEAEEAAEKKVAAAEAWVEAVKANAKEVSMRTETLVRESGMMRVEEERVSFKMERSLSRKRSVEEEIEKVKRNSEAESYRSTKPVGKMTPGGRGKGRRYSSAGTPSFFVIKKKKKVPTLVKFFGRRR